MQQISRAHPPNFLGGRGRRVYAESAVSEMERVSLLSLCLPALCLALDNGLRDSENVEINPLDSLTLNPGEFTVPQALGCVHTSTFD